MGQRHGFLVAAWGGGLVVERGGSMESKEADGCVHGLRLQRNFRGIETDFMNIGGTGVELLLGKQHVKKRRSGSLPRNGRRSRYGLKGGASICLPCCPLHPAGL